MDIVTSPSQSAGPLRRHFRSQWQSALLWTGLALVTGACLWQTGFFHLLLPAELSTAWANFSSTVMRELLPPDFGRWRHWIRPFIDTMTMSVGATVLCVIVAFPISLCAARNTSPHWTVYQACRALFNALRAVPDLIMAVFFVAAVGFGALPGVLALGLHSAGMVGKFYAEYIEHSDPAPVEAARAAGAGRFQSILHAVMPQVMPQIADVTIYRWEYHFRASVVVGMVGVGGIGGEISKAVKLYNWDQVLAMLIIVFALVMVVDGAGSLLRRWFK